MIARLEEIKQFRAENDHFGHGFLGIEIMELDEVHSVVRIKIEQKMMNLRGIPHGGVVFSVADIAAGVAMAGTGDHGVTLSSNVMYIGSVTEGYIYAEARLVSSTFRTMSYYVEVKAEDGKLLATFQTVMYKKPLKSEQPIEAGM